MAKKKSLGSAAKTSEPVSTVDERPVQPESPVGTLGGVSVYVDDTTTKPFNVVASVPRGVVDPLAVVRFYPNGKVAAWRATGRDLEQVRGLCGRTRDLWPAIDARCDAATVYWFNANGRQKPIARDEDFDAWRRKQERWT